jgi:hypothetical protein
LVPSADPRHCSVCDATAGANYTFSNGAPASISWQPASVQAGACVCAAPGAGTVVADVLLAGQRYKKCISCPAGTAADAATSSCLAANASRQPDLAFVLAALNARGASLSSQAATQAAWQNVLQGSGRSQLVTVPNSEPLAALLGPAARQCMEHASRDACSALANLCALQMYGRCGGGAAGRAAGGAPGWLAALLAAGEEGALAGSGPGCCRRRTGATRRP